jgi:enoyl-CoA hydratase/carnithine racemase
LISISLFPGFVFGAGAYMSLVQIEDRGAVRHVVMTRAEKRNAMNGEMVLALGDAFREAAGDESVRIVVVRGDGPMFSSGMDLGSLADLSADPSGLRPFRAEVLRAWNWLEEMTKPTICQIHGACIGGAMELALAADMRVMAEDAVAGLLETRIGLLPDVGGCSRLPAVVGLGIAKELIMTGRVVDGREAHRIGFANRIAPADELDATCEALCNELLACAPLAVGLAKRVMDSAAKPALAATLEQEVTSQQLLASTDDFAEGTRAFREKRDPEYAGH